MQGRLQLEAVPLLLGKQGAAAHECEDSFGIRSDVLRYCVADGATEAFDSGTWARLLTGAWLESPAPILGIDEFKAWVADLGLKAQARWDGVPLSWYAAEKASRGSFAAFIGIVFQRSENAFLWESVALGDCCIVQRKAESNLGVDSLRVVPSTLLDGFPARPVLVPSLVSLQDLALEHMVREKGIARPGDVFLLLSDAIAAWYLAAARESPPSVAEFERLVESHPDQASAFISSLRSRHAIRNDDVAVVRVKVAPAPNATGTAGPG